MTNITLNKHIDIKIHNIMPYIYYNIKDGIFAMYYVHLEYTSRERAPHL